MLVTVCVVLFCVLILFFVCRLSIVKSLKTCSDSGDRKQFLKKTVCAVECNVDDEDKDKEDGG